mgnify:CR=1 FL=1
MRQSVVTMPSRQGGATQANDRKESGLCDHAAVMRQASIGTANTGRRSRQSAENDGSDKKRNAQTQHPDDAGNIRVVGDAPGGKQ